MNALRLVLGTLTVLPVRPPSRVDRSTAGWAMALAPLAGLLLAVVPVGLLLLATGLHVALSPLLAAALALALLAISTRAMHLDGLADTADGLGSGRPAGEALAIMRQSDIGPFGVVALLMVLLVQVAALAQCLAAGTGPAALLVALVASRGLLVLLCTPAFRAARPDGLGALVAGSVGSAQAVAGLLLAVALAGLGLVAVASPGGAVEEQVVRLAVAAPFGVLPGLGLAVHARRRLGGVTGDVHGAAVETAFAGVLVAAALAV